MFTFVVTKRTQMEANRVIFGTWEKDSQDVNGRMSDTLLQTIDYGILSGLHDQVFRIDRKTGDIEMEFAGTDTRGSFMLVGE